MLRKHYKTSNLNNFWTFPSDANLRQEYKVEYEMRGGAKSFLGGNVFPTFEDFKMAVQNGEIVEITPEMDDQIGYRSHTGSKESLKSLISGYRSWGMEREAPPEEELEGDDPKHYRSEKTLNNLYDRISLKKPMYMPIILRKNGRLRILCGNTRMDVAFQLGINPKAIIIEAPKF